VEIELGTLRPAPAAVTAYSYPGNHRRGVPVSQRADEMPETPAQAVGLGKKTTGPNLLVYFDDLAWRAVGTVGGDEGVHTFENDTGPDDANHAQDGLLIMAGPGVEPGRSETMSLLDVAPTVLELLGLEPPAGMRGTSLLEPGVELSRPR